MTSSIIIDIEINILDDLYPGELWIPIICYITKAELDTRAMFNVGKIQPLPPKKKKRKKRAFWIETKIKLPQSKRISLLLTDDRTNEVQLLHFAASQN